MRINDSNCAFCKIVNGQIPDYRVWESKNFVAFLDIRPIALGHVLIIPREHIDYVFDLSDIVYSELFRTGKIIAPAIHKATKCKRVGIAIEGFGMPHAHLHLVPLFHGNEMDPNRAHEVSINELGEMQKKIKNTLTSIRD